MLFLEQNGVGSCRKIKNIFVKTGEVGTDTIAACGVVSAPCRGADLGLSLTKAAISLTVDGNGRPATGVAGGGW